MPYLHSMHCPDCGHDAKVCTSDEDGCVLGVLFQYTCPNCSKEVMFTCKGVEILDGDTCPKDSVIGQLYLRSDASAALSLVPHQDQELTCLQREVLIAWNFQLLIDSSSWLHNEHEHSSALIRQLDQVLTNSQRQVFIEWARQLLVIRDSDKTSIQKAKEAIEITQRMNIVLPLLAATGTNLKNILWKDRNWATRIGLGATALAVLGFGSQGAGIAALGGAIGVPLWIVCGGGGAFIGMLIDVLQQSLTTGSK